MQTHFNKFLASARRHVLKWQKGVAFVWKQFPHIRNINMLKKWEWQVCTTSSPVSTEAKSNQFWQKGILFPNAEQIAKGQFLNNKQGCIG